jgi:hypothetical protein
MNEDQFDSKVKELFHDDSIPTSVRKRMDDTYDRIESEAKKTKRFSLFTVSKGLRAALIGGGLLTVSAAGVLATQGLNLFNSNGESIMELTKPEPDILEWDAAAAEEYKEKVKPGEALVYYHVRDYPEKKFTVYRQPRIFSNYEAYKEAILHTYSPSETLPFGLNFVTGKITVDAEQSQFSSIEAELYEEAANSDKEVVAKIVEAEEKKDQIVAVTQYVNEDTEVFVRSSSKIELYENMPLDDGEIVISKLELPQSEAFYLKQENGQFPYQSILWIQEQDGTKVMFEVLTYSLDMPKAKLAEIAEDVSK